jgi:hypothetical protein
MPSYEKILRLTANDCIGRWRDVCEMIAMQNRAFTLEEVYTLIKHLAGLWTWQAWVIANQVYRKYVPVPGSGMWIEDRFNRDIGIKILWIVRPAIHSNNPTIVTNSAIIYAGIWYRSSINLPMPKREKAILFAVYERLPPKFIEEKDELGFFLRMSEGFVSGG